MKETTNLKLKKYDYSDATDMSIAHNPNMDTIDIEIHNLKNTLGTGLKASNVTIEDTTNVFTATTVEGALLEVMTKAKGNETSISSLEASVNGAKAKLALEQDKFVDLIY